MDSLVLGVGLLVSLAMCRWLSDHGPQLLTPFRDAQIAESAVGQRQLTFPVLCINRAEDEALTALSFVGNLTNLPSILVSRITLGSLGAAILSLIYVGVVPSLSAFGTVSEMIADSSRAVSWSAKALFFVGSSSIYMGLLTLAAVAAALLFSFFVRGLAFGDWRHPLGNLYGRMTVTLLPLSSRHVEFVEAPPQAEGASGRPLHQIYDEPRVCKLVQEWVARQIRTLAPGGGGTNPDTVTSRDALG